MSDETSGKGENDFKLKNNMTSESLSYSELKRRLKKPIDRKLLSQKKAGGTSIDFLNITDLKDELDSRLAPNHWEAIVKQTMLCGENLIMIVSLIIHADDGVYCQDGTGIESINLRGYGDVASNSYAQALRRAAESHGFCRELWRAELSAEQKEIQQEANKPDLATRIRNAQNAIKALGGDIGTFDLSNSTDEEKTQELEGLTEQYRRLKASKQA